MQSLKIQFAFLGQNRKISKKMWASQEKLTHYVIWKRPLLYRSMPDVIFSAGRRASDPGACCCNSISPFLLIYYAVVGNYIPFGLF